MVSIILPVYNREKLISRAIDSVIKQTYHNWELLVVNDNSTDRTQDVVNTYCNLDSRIHCIPNENSKGCAGARNTGIKYAKGKYVAFLDSDDEFIDIHLEECISALKTTKYALCSALWIENKYGELNYIGQNYPNDYAYNKMQEDLGINRHDKLWIFDKRLFEYIVYTDFYCYQLCTIVVERELLVRTNGFNEKFQRCEDIELIYRLLQHTSLVTVNSYHYMYNYGSDNLYAFTNHGKMGISQMKQDKRLFSNYVSYLYYRILVLEGMLRLIDLSQHIQDKKKAKQHLSNVLYNRCMSYSYVNKKYSKKNRFFGFIKAVKYITHALREDCLIPLPGYREKHLLIY